MSSLTCFTSKPYYFGSFDTGADLFYRGADLFAEVQIFWQGADLFAEVRTFGCFCRGANYFLSFCLGEQICNPSSLLLTGNPIGIAMGETSSAARDDEQKTLTRNAFWRVAQEGLYRILEEAPAVWKGSNSRFYRAEKSIIMEHVDPFYWGAVVTVFLFATFRVSGSRRYTQFRDWYLYGKNNGLRSWSDQKAVQILAEDATRLPTDAFVSLFCGLSSMVWLSKPSKLHQDFSQSPLVWGKSLIHEHVCPSMVDAYTEQLRRNPRVEHLSKEDNVLKTFATFVQNCQIRSSVIEKRVEQGAERPDVIPYPGIKGVTRDQA